MHAKQIELGHYVHTNVIRNKWVYNIISRCIIGQKFVDKNGKTRLGSELSRKIMVLLVAFCFGDFYSIRIIKISYTL
jgi:hypothetical protein